MTVEEFYEYCKQRNITDFKILVSKISRSGCFIGFEELTPDNMDIGYSDKAISF